MMDITPTLFWFVAALLIAGAEMFTGTIYLLIVALGCVVGGVCSYLSATLSIQLAACALFIIVGCFWVRRMKTSRGSASAKLMTLDEGQRVTVKTVRADGTAVVDYRGAPWTAVPEHGSLTPGVWVIARVDGNRLLLKQP